MCLCGRIHTTHIARDVVCVLYSVTVLISVNYISNHLTWAIWWIFYTYKCNGQSVSYKLTWSAKIDLITMLNKRMEIWSFRECSIHAWFLMSLCADSCKLYHYIIQSNQYSIYIWKVTIASVNHYWPDHVPCRGNVHYGKGKIKFHHFCAFLKSHREINKSKELSSSLY